MKSQVIGKDFDAGKDLGQEEKGSIEDEMVGCHHCTGARPGVRIAERNDSRQL